MKDVAALRSLSLAAKVLDMPKFSTWLASEIAFSALGTLCDVPDSIAKTTNET
jgi:hypothetical protein